MTTDTFLKPGLNIIIIDVLILTGIITAISVFAGHADIVLLLSWIIVAAYTAMTHRYMSLFHLLMSTLLAVAWVYIARENYGYNHSYITIAGVNLLPLLAWSLGLVGVSEIFNHFKTKRKINNFILFIPIFWILLILIETYAFHVIEIRDTLSGNTIGLPFCNCIHAPWWMRFVYFSLGPIYYALTMLSDSLILKYSNPV